MATHLATQCGIVWGYVRSSSGERAAQQQRSKVKERWQREKKTLLRPPSAPVATMNWDELGAALYERSLKERSLVAVGQINNNPRPSHPGGVDGGSTRDDPPRAAPLGVVGPLLSNKNGHHILSGAGGRFHCIVALPRFHMCVCMCKELSFFNKQRGIKKNTHTYTHFFAQVRWDGLQLHLDSSIYTFSILLAWATLSEAGCFHTGNNGGKEKKRG